MTHRNRLRDVEVCVMGLLPRGHGHCGMVEGPAEMDLLVATVPQPDKRIVGGHLRIVTVAVRLRQAVQLTSAKPIRVSAMQHLGNVRDGRAPVMVGRSGGSKDLEVRGAIGVQHLARGQQQQPAIEGERAGGVRRGRHGVQGRAVELEEPDWETRPAGVDTARDHGADHTQNVAVRKKSGWSVEGAQEIPA